MSILVVFPYDAIAISVPPEFFDIFVSFQVFRRPAGEGIAVPAVIRAVRVIGA